MHLISPSLSLITALTCISMAQASVISSKIMFWNLQQKGWDEVRKILAQNTRFQDGFFVFCFFYVGLIVTFYNHNSDFFIAIARLYLTIM